MKKHIVLSSLIIVGIVIILLYQQNKHEFTINKWNKITYNERQLLAKDFIKKYKNKDLSKNDIINMLGTDTENNFEYYNRYKTSDNFLYDFGGKKSYYSSGNIAMIIKFDENDMATTYEIIEYSW